MCGGDLAREWTDTFGVLSPSAEPATTTGPMRYSTPRGLASLVHDLLGDIEVGTETVAALPDGDVVLAMPDPQASRLTDVPDAVEFEPVIAVACEYAQGLDRAGGIYHAGGLPFAGAAFVNDHDDVTFVADDGARRGDAAPVLVAHTTAARAGRHLDDPDAAIPTVVSALADLTGADDPAHTVAHRWTFAKPIGQHSASHHLGEVDGRLVGFAGDQWCPDGTPRVESAWRSGIDLAGAILAAGRH